MNTVHIELTEEQAQILANALDFYIRVGIGQFEAIPRHPTFKKTLETKTTDNGDTDWGKYHKTMDDADKMLSHLKPLLTEDLPAMVNGSYGIYADSVDKSCLVMQQLRHNIMHELYKANGETRIGVDADERTYIEEKINVNIKQQEKK